ncbi:hypothetical protein Halhy_4045 [Haliscomenobacter hydrossis DSM 1100]|uniref:Uncharacterized protein n=1 Tax=Haliscomenobacter hydrossis (strain ATCC 27775 / DSM 1100 / LMG 10767 / O) TaxID=760192 RepID=F4L5Q8_HALH1|nr:hypothetical protein Halhy_4045 [Haliscomenobacter hydrossis DSM 1100]
MLTNSLDGSSAKITPLRVFCFWPIPGRFLDHLYQVPESFGFSSFQCFSIF